MIALAQNSIRGSCRQTLWGMSSTVFGSPLQSSRKAGHGHRVSRGEPTTLVLRAQGVASSPGGCLPNLSADSRLRGSDSMKKTSRGERGFERETVRTRQREFRGETSLVTPWGELVLLMSRHARAPGTKGAGSPFAVDRLLPTPFLPRCVTLSDPTMDEALNDTPMFLEFVRLDAGKARMLKESTILRSFHLLVAHHLRLQSPTTVNAALAAKGLLVQSNTVVETTLIAAPRSTKNSGGERDPEMRQAKKALQ